VSYLTYSGLNFSTVGASSPSSIGARAVTSLPASSFTASAANCVSSIAKGRSPRGLVVNAIIVWNTIYMDAALDQLRAERFDVRDEDVASGFPEPALCAVLL
jgi:hypothetical protein